MVSGILGTGAARWWAGTTVKATSNNGCKDNDIKLNVINTGPVTTNYMTYQYKYNTICCRNPNEVGLGAQATINGGAKKVASLAPTKDDSYWVGPYK